MQPEFKIVEVLSKLEHIAKGHLGSLGTDEWKIL